jgi:NDP-sugar pyrophosphorylase family protein
MKVLILAGGLGTRLRPLVSDRPKPMAKAAGRPFLAHQLEWIREQGFHDVILCLGYRARQIQGYFQDGSAWDVRLGYSIEAQPLGTAGAVKHAAEHLVGPFVVLNGDSFLSLSLHGMVDFHQSRRRGDPPALGTLAAAHVADASEAGTLELDPRDRIRTFCEKMAAGPGWVNGGIYVLEPDFLDLIPDDRAVSLERETFPLALEQDLALYAYRTEGVLIDIGTPQGLRRFRQHLRDSTS